MIDADSFIPWEWVSTPPSLRYFFSRYGYDTYVKGENRPVSPVPLRSKQKSKLYNFIVVDTCVCCAGSKVHIDSGSGIGATTQKNVFLTTNEVFEATDFGTLESVEEAWAQHGTYLGKRACYTTVRLSGNGRAPFKLIAPMLMAITYNYLIHLIQSGRTVYYEVEGWHDGFPAHEFYISYGGRVFATHSFVPPGSHWVGSPFRLLGFWKPERVSLKGQFDVIDNCCQ